MPKVNTCEEPYSEHAQAPAAKEIKNLEMLMVEIVSMLEGAGVKFPIKTKEELLKVFPPGESCGCHYKGKTLTLNDLAKTLSAKDFPIASAGDVAIMMAGRCPV